MSDRVANVSNRLSLIAKSSTPVGLAFKTLSEDEKVLSSNVIDLSASEIDLLIGQLAMFKMSRHFYVPPGSDEEG